MFLGFICMVSFQDEYNKTYCSEESQLEHAKLYRYTFNNMRESEMKYETGLLCTRSTTYANKLSLLKMLILSFLFIY